MNKITKLEGHALLVSESLLEHIGVTDSPDNVIDMVKNYYNIDELRLGDVSSNYTHYMAVVFKEYHEGEHVRNLVLHIRQVKQY